MLKRCIYCFAIFLSVIFISCDDEEPSDVQKPIIDIEILQHGVAVDAANPVRGIITLKATAEDNQKVKSIQLFVDDQLVGEADDVTVLESSFDTRTLEDKAHTVKVIVEDNAGNVSTMTSDVTTKNVLFHYSFPAGHHYYPDEWMVLSDKSGKVIEYKKITGNTEYVFFYPLDFTQNDFDYTLIQKEKLDAMTTAFYVKTLKNLQLGEYSISPSPPGMPIKGKFSVFFEGFEPNDFSIGLETSAEWPAPNHMRIFIGESPVSFFISIQDKYVYKPSLGVGQSLTINQDFIDTKMIPLSSTIIPNTGEGFVEVGGVRSGGSLMHFLNPYSTLGDIEIKYPKELKGDGFTDFRTTIDFERTENTRKVQNRYVAIGIPSSLSELQSTLATVSSLHHDNIKLSLAGSADRIALNYYYSGYEATTNSNVYFGWSLNMPFSSSIDTKFPDLPSALKSAMGLSEIPDIRASYMILSSTTPAFTNDQYSTMLIKGYSAEYWASERHSKLYYFNKNESGGRAGK